MSGKDGGHAFMNVDGGPGMTLRDYFAAKAMQVFCANAEGFVNNQDRAEEAYRMADAMLAERSKT